MKKCAITVLLCLVASMFHHAAASGYRQLKGELLTNTQINCIVQDVRGFIWLGTDYGLNRFDGQNVTQYTPVYGDPSALGGNQVRSIAPCKDGSLWIGLSDGMQRFCPRDDNFHSITFPDEIWPNKPNVTAILNLQDGNVAIGTSGFGLFVMKDDKSYTARLWDEVNSRMDCEYINCLFEDSNGRLWIGSHDHSAWIHDPKTGRTWRCTPADDTGEITFIGEDASGRVYVLTHTRIYSFRRGSNECSLDYSIGEGGDIVSATMTDEGVLMAMRHNGLRLWDHQRGEFTEYNPLVYTSPQLQHSVRRAFKDRDNNLWLCSNTMGLLMVAAPGQAFSHWGHDENDTDLDGTIYCIWPGESGSTNVAFETQTVVNFDQNGRALHRTKDWHTVCSVCRTQDGRTWMGHFYGGLSYIEAGKQQLVHTPYSDGMCINAIAEDSEGRLWYAPFGYGFCMLQPSDGTLQQFSTKDSTVHLGNDWLNHLALDNKGRVWLAHCVGVQRYDPTVGRCENFAELDSLPFTFCFYVCPAHDGTIWLGTDNGVVSYDPATRATHHYTTADGLCNDNISAIVEDAAGRIWVSTQNGLSRITLGDTTQITSFYAGDGLEERQYSPKACYYDAAQDRVYLGGQHGVTSFSPSRLESRRTVPDVRLMGLFINGQPASARTMSGGRQVMDVAVTEASEFFLSYEDNSFTMELGITSFADTRAVAYEYTFDGKTWSATLPGQHHITFTHLAAGTYPLQVRAVVGDSVSVPKQYVIHISAPWYATPMAYLIYILLFVGVMTAIVVAYLRWQKAELNESKLVFFTNISHEIRTPMTMIVSPLDKLLSTGDFQPEVRRSLVVMRQNAGRILTLMNQLLDIRKFDKGQMKLHCRPTDMVGFLEGLVHLFDEQARQRGINFEFRHPDETVEAWVDQKHIDKVAMNLLSNAFKFTPDGGTIVMELTTTPDTFTVSVTDTGVGLDPRDKARIFERFYRSAASDGKMGTGIGLHLSAELMRLHHGTLTGDNRSDGTRGSIFTFSLPLGSEYLSEEEISTTPPITPPQPSPQEEGDLESPSQTTNPSAPNSNNTTLSPVEESRGGARNASTKSGARVMIVDDDEEILSYLKGELQSHYRVTLCRDGQEALNSALREQPAVIVSDVMMPVMDGCTMVRRLRGNANISHVPVILLSARSEVEDRIQGLSHGADAYLAKPFHTDELLALIRGLIESRQRLRGAYSGARDQEDRVEKIEMQSSDELLMARLMKVVNQHLSDSDFNIELLASEVGLSRTHLHRKLKTLTGLSASEFLRNLRMRQAEQLLREKRMNISQIAYAVGFGNQTHFSTAFKKYSGLSPTEFIEQL